MRRRRLRVLAGVPFKAIASAAAIQSVATSWINKMSDAVGGSAGFGLSRSGLDAEIARYKKQLADCVNCPATSDSLQGKAVIQDLSNKIAADQQTLRQAESTPPPDQRVAVTPADEANAYTATGAAAPSGDSSPGGRLNVYA